MKQYSMTNPQMARWLGGVAVGAMAMYLADPAQGKRRRWLMREKLRTASDRTGSTLSHVMHGTGDRLSAAQSRAKSVLKRDALDNESLQERVHGVVRKLTRFPEEIRIKAEQGCVTLSGLIAAKEKSRLFQKVQRIPGVRELRDHLETRSEHRARWFQRDGRQKTEHEPAKAAVRSTALAGAVLGGAARHLPLGPLLAIAGLGYAIKTLGKDRFKRADIGRVASEQHAVHLQKSIEIQASPETVFNIWSKYDNFPQFMSHLVEIQSYGAQHSHWSMQGPAGVNLEWDAVLTKYMPPTMLAWKTEPGAPIEHSGSVRFESANGGTRATVRMLYSPGPGRKSDILTSLLGDDPEQELEADLQRMKNFIEGKNFPRDIPQVSSSSGQVLH